MTPIELSNGSDSFCVDLDAVSCLYYQDGEIVLEFAGSTRFLRIKYDESAYQAVKDLYLGKISIAEFIERDSEPSSLSNKRMMI